MTRWTFSDSVSSTTYSFEINPNQDAPVYQKSLQVQGIVIPDSVALLLEGADQPSVFSVQGTLLTETQYQQLLFFYHLRHQFLCTDDLGRQRWLYITEFQPVRTRSATYPWRHTYTLSGFVISETLPAVSNPTGAVAPSVTAISPHVGAIAGGTSVTITGTNFSPATAVTFGGTAAIFSITNSTTIVATSPAGVAGLEVHIQVTDGAISSPPTSADLFTYNAAPTVTSMTPTSGSDVGGQSVMIAGTGFTGATAVEFGATAASSFVINRSTSITAVTPAAADATVDVTVTTPVGTSGTSSADHYTFVAPDLSSMILMAGPQENNA